jgi:hypothetical protein
MQWPVLYACTGQHCMHAVASFVCMHWPVSYACTGQFCMHALASFVCMQWRVLYAHMDTFCMYRTILPCVGMSKYACSHQSYGADASVHAVASFVCVYGCILYIKNHYVRSMHAWLGSEISMDPSCQPFRYGYPAIAKGWHDGPSRVEYDEYSGTIRTI